MTKKLFFICPTDHLEPVLNINFKSENYFYTSLGNSFCPDAKSIIYLTELIHSQQIKEVCFVLSHDNQIALNAMHGQSLNDIIGQRRYFLNMRRTQKHAESWLVQGCPIFNVLSFYLNFKIKELQTDLKRQLSLPKISGKIYDRNTDTFRNIYSELICNKDLNFN